TVNGCGLALLDPHGDLVETILARVPPERTNDLIYFDVPDTSAPLAFNPLSRVPPAQRPLVASGLIEAFKKIWSDSWGPRSAHILRNSLLALLELPEATIADILQLFDDERYRKRVAERVAQPHVRRFWLREYEGYPPRL